MNESNVIDLSAIQNGAEPPAFEELTPEEQQHLAQLAQENGINPEPEELEVSVAFLVFVTNEGQVVAHQDIKMPIKPKRGVSLDDMYGAVSNVKRDIEAQTAAQATLSLQASVAQQMAQQQQAQQLQASLGDLKRGNPNPNGPPPRRRR